jgi:NTP pyrophosphatase (non-canonical NTP hydrolase)
MSTNQANAFDRYQEAAARTANMDNEKIIKRLQDNPVLLGLLNGALGAAGEAGEIADHIKKVVFHGHDLDVEYLVKECGDDIWYLADILRRLQIKLSHAAGVNIKKLKDRYPDGFDEQKSINREA